MHAGGYGYLGVCHDSVAVVQAAMQEEVTLFPCLLAGQAEGVMSKMYTVRVPTCGQTLPCMRPMKYTQPLRRGLAGWFAPSDARTLHAPCPSSGMRLMLVL